MNRASLLLTAAFNTCSVDSSGNPCVWLNSYSCRICTSEQIDWTDVWSCQCNDSCPNCGMETEPEESVWIGPGEADTTNPQYVLWEALPEA